ncbi:MAG: TIGR02996 domain-containing protein [Myxococcaceae bacterium]
MVELEPLFAAVFERPADDGPRHVLADALQEAGDPRGEFISLQLQARRNERSERRMQKLLDRHRETFLRGLKPLVMPGDQVWRRGFLESATVLLDGLQVDLPDLATLRSLEVVFSPAAPLELASPHMKSLTEVRLVSVNAVPVLFQAKRPLAIEAVGLEGPGDLRAWTLDHVTAVSRAESLPSLARLRFVANLARFDETHWLWKLEVNKRLKQLEIDGSFRALNLFEVITAAQHAAVLPTHVVFQTQVMTLRFHGADRFRSLQVELHARPAVAIFAAMLDTLPPDALDELTIEADSHWLQAADSGLLRTATRRFELRHLALPGR